MRSPEIRRILETCLNQGGLEVWLLADRMPLLRFADCVREMLTNRPLSAGDVTNLVLDGAINLRAFWEREGFARFDYACDWRDARFRVFLVRHGESAMATLTPILADTPELKYSEDDPSPAAAG